MVILIWCWGFVRAGEKSGKPDQRWWWPFLPLFSQIGAMVLLISPEQIELESCACAQIEARGEGNRWVYGIRYLGFIRKAGYCNIKKSLPFWSWFWIVLPFHHPNQPYYRDEGFCYTTDFLLALWVILGETNYMTHSFIQLVPFLCKFLIVMHIGLNMKMTLPSVGQFRWGVKSFV